MTDSYAGPLCGDETCELCPTQGDLDVYAEQQEEDARQIVRYMLGLDEGGTHEPR
jgi:hypothetical protein